MENYDKNRDVQGMNQDETMLFGAVGVSPSSRVRVNQVSKWQLEKRMNTEKNALSFLDAKE